MKSPWASLHALLLVALLLASCAPQQTGRPAAAARRGGATYHVVKPGENLFRIGQAYDVSHEELARLNGIRDPARIRVGQRILIPGAGGLPPAEMGTSEEPATPSAPRTFEPAGDGFFWPTQGTIHSGFGPRGQSFHDGIDIAAPEGTTIHAIESGEVIYSDRLRGYGNIVILRHDDGLVSVYAHNQVNLVREGNRVERGEVIARVGSTGRVTGPHLHFEIRKNNRAVDPMRYLPQLCCAPASANLPPES
jgi:murein DD-endopeptidase MepM/ murein hydrolase activator NlpD